MRRSWSQGRRASAAAVVATASLALAMIVAGTPSALGQAADETACGGDPFDGTTLDESRWTTIVRPDPAGYRVADGQLRLRALTGDMFGDRATAQNLILQDVPEGAWTLTTRLDSSAFDREGQQAGLMVYTSDATWSKFVVIDKGDVGRWFEHIHTRDQQSRLQIGVDTTDPLPAGFPAVVSIRVISDGNTIRGEYSGDGETWLPIGRPAPIGADVKVGLYAADNEADGPEIPFDFVSLAPQSDEFDGDALETCRWSQIVRPDEDAVRVQDGRLEIDAGSGEVGDTATNLIGQPVPAGTWEAETSIVLDTSAAGQQAGLLLYLEPENWVKTVLVDKGAASQIELVRVKDGEYLLDAPFKVDVPKDLTSFRLRMRSDGKFLTAQYSPDGDSWTEVGKARDISDLGAGHLGPMSLLGGAPPITASFDYVRVRTWTPTTTNLFDTIGITQSDTRENSEIYGNPTPYSLPAEEMPPSRTVGPGSDDEFDEVPLRMPDTTGTVPNLAAFRGQTLTLRPQAQREYARIHFFGMTTDGGPAGGEFILRYEDDSTQPIRVDFRDWCAPQDTASHHVAIGPLTKRYRTEGQDGARCAIYHVPAATETGKALVSITLPSTTTPARPNIQGYLMALTLEEPGGVYELPDLAGRVEFPDDHEAPVSTHELDPPEPDGNGGWYAGAVEVTLGATDEGGSQVEQIMYRIDGGPPRGYARPFDFPVDGEHTLEYRAIDGAGNAEPYNSVALKVDANAPETVATTRPGNALGDGGWYDSAVEVTLAARDGSGSGAEATWYRLDDGSWQRYERPLTVSEPGVHRLEYRSDDVAGNAEAASELRIQVDGTAPTTSLGINGAAAQEAYAGPVRVALTAADGDGSGVVGTEYRLDGGAWTAYEGAFDVTSPGAHAIDFRSRDLAGNVENFRTASFSVAGVAPSGTPAPPPRPFAALAGPSRKRSTVAALRRGRLSVTVSCQSVDRGALRLVVSRRTARRLGLKSRTLAKRTVRCAGQGRATVRLRPPRAVRRALAKADGSLSATLRLEMHAVTGGEIRDAQAVRLRG